VATIKEIAHKAGVSQATVSRVFSGRGYVDATTKEKVMEVSEELNYKPKQYKKRSTVSVYKKVIGVIVADINNTFFTEIIKGISRQAYSEGLDLVICDTDENPEREIRCLDILRQKHIGGLIISPTSDVIEYNTEYLKNMNKSGVPVVMLDRDVKIPGTDGVFLDNYRVSFDAVQTLIDNGHKEIAIITGPTTSKPGIDRLNGYFEALKANNIPIREKQVYYGDFKKESAFKATKELLRTQKNVTAIFSSNSLMSIGCIQALADSNVTIPDDMAFISAGHHDLFEFYGIHISATKRPTLQMGEEAARILIEKMQKGRKQKATTSKRVIFHYDLVLRGSEKFPKNRRDC